MILGVALATAALWFSGTVVDRRRQAHFAALAHSLGSEMVREGEFRSSFSVEIGGRMFEVCLQYFGSGIGSNWAPGWCVLTEVALEGVSDLHSVEIRARRRRPKVIDPRDPDFGNHFTIHDAGYPPRDGWLNERVRGAIAHFYAFERPLESLSIEEGSLVHRSHLPVQRLDGALLRELLTRQGAVAEALERAL